MSIEIAVSTRHLTVSAVSAAGAVLLSSSSLARWRHLFLTSVQRSLTSLAIGISSFPRKVEHVRPPAMLFNAPKAIRDSPFQVNELHLVTRRRFFYLQSKAISEQLLYKPAPQGVYVHADDYQLLSNCGPSI
ncbi:hypothetical protein [Dysosmobacter sp.]|uniref:hypothetical protein n=1 Tax=Dysosmobacter sp. TaxID=2591382 RepID=UPI002A8E3873|nr:hypothetical protein [Dysosmobacter sp.]MDY3984266.1 hypothetical protein [Dysosmobacter sp.]